MGAAHCRRQPGTCSLGGRGRRAARHLADPRLVRANQPAPALQRRPPPIRCRALPDRTRHYRRPRSSKLTERNPGHTTCAIPGEVQTSSRSTRPRLKHPDRVRSPRRRFAMSIAAWGRLAARRSARGEALADGELGCLPLTGRPLAPGEEFALSQRQRPRRVLASAQRPLTAPRRASRRHRTESQGWNRRFSASLTYSP